MEIASTMGTGSFGRELCLRPLVGDLVGNSETPIDTNFTSEEMVKIYLGDDSRAFTLYRTGSFQTRGTKTEVDLEEAEFQLRTLLSGVGVEMLDYEFRHVTSVFVGTLDTNVNLEALTIALGLEQTEYEPEQFPTIVYCPPEFAVTLLIFRLEKSSLAGQSTDKRRNPLSKS